MIHLTAPRERIISTIFLVVLPLILYILSSSSYCCHCCCCDFAVSASLLTQGDRRKCSQRSKDQDQAQHSFHKTPAHPTQHSSHRQCPLLLSRVEAHWESGRPQWQQPRCWPRRPASQSLQLCKVEWSVVWERDPGVLLQGQDFVLRQEFVLIPLKKKEPLNIELDTLMLSLCITWRGAELFVV